MAPEQIGHRILISPLHCFYDNSMTYVFSNTNNCAPFVLLPKFKVILSKALYFSAQDGGIHHVGENDVSPSGLFDGMYLNPYRPVLEKDTHVDTGIYLYIKFMVLQKIESSILSFSSSLIY